MYAWAQVADTVVVVAAAAAGAADASWRGRSWHARD